MPPSSSVLRCIACVVLPSLFSFWAFLDTAILAYFPVQFSGTIIKSVNGQELESWKKIDLNTFLSQLGADHWEMTGTISISAGEHRAGANYLFFKRIKP